MATTNDLKNGMTLSIDGALWSVVEFQHVKPGKGGAFVRTKLKNVLSGKVVDRTFNAGVRVEVANVDKREMQYLYREGDDFVFMDTTDYDQPRIPAAVVGDAANYLLEEQTATIAFNDGTALYVELPAAVEMTVQHTDPGLQGDRSTGGTKPATLETDPMAQAVLELPAVPFRLDQVSCAGVDVLHVGAHRGGADTSHLGRRHQFVDFQLPWQRQAEGHGSRHVRVISAVSGTAVDGDEVPALQHPAARRMVRYRAIRPARDDRVERGRLGAEIHHGPLDEDCNVALSAPGPDCAEHGGEGLISDRAGPGKQLDLRLVLDHPQLFDNVPQRHEVWSACLLGERRVPLDRHVLRLERQRAVTAVSSQRSQGELELALDEQLDVGAVPLGCLGIAGVGAEHGRPVGRQQERHIGADQSGQVADVGRAGDQRRVRARFGDLLLRTHTASSVGVGHTWTLATGRPVRPVSPARPRRRR